MSEKDIDLWTEADWFDEAERLTGDSDRDGDAVICAAMLLASLREGPKITKIAKAIGKPVDRIRWMFNNLRDNGVFKRDKIVAEEWFDEETGGCAFNLAVGCGLGWLAKAST